MPTATIDGIPTRYEILGDGPPLLMYAPGGFNAVLENWRVQGVYAKIKLLDHLPKKYACILFDRRECGQSGGRVEAVTWADYVAQGKGLLEHLKIERAHLLGGCMGCCPVAAFGVMHPQMVMSMVLWWPVGGAKYRIASHRRFEAHLAFLRERGLDAVVAVATNEGKPFGGDPRGGPWASVIRRESDFAAAYVRQDVEAYERTVLAMMQQLFDRDTAPGAEPEDLMSVDVPALVVPGSDDSHATSAARYLHECLPKSEYWDIPVAMQTEETAPSHLLQFIERAGVLA